MADINKQFHGVLKSIRQTINPEYAIPKEHTDSPVNERIRRLRESVAKLQSLHQEIAATTTKIQTNLNAMIEEVQPLLDSRVVSAEPKDVSSQSPDKASAVEEKSTGSTLSDSVDQKSSDDKSSVEDKAEDPNTTKSSSTEKDTSNK